MVSPMKAFGARSLEILSAVHPDLQRIANLAIQLSPVDFAVICGLRTIEEEAAEVAKGASETMHSRHIDGFAIDIEAMPDGAGSWDIPYYQQIAEAFENASAQLNIPIVWGGCWKTLKDYGHFELDRAAYPDLQQTETGV